MNAEIKQIVSADDLELLTGAKQSKKQAEVLEEHGIYYIKRKDGVIVTTWHHVNHPTRIVNATNDSEPDFSKVM